MGWLQRSDNFWFTRGFQSRTNEMPTGRSSCRGQRQVSRTRIWSGWLQLLQFCSASTGRNAVMVRSHITLLLHWSVWPISNLRVHERHFFPISPCLIHPQHLSPHQRAQRQQSQHYPKQLAEPAAGFCHLLAVMKTGQIKNMFPIASFTWKIISSQLTSKKWPGKGSRNEIWWQIDKYGQLSLWWSIILDGSSIYSTRIFCAQTHKSQAFILCQYFKSCPQSIFEEDSSWWKASCYF